MTFRIFSTDENHTSNRNQKQPKINNMKYTITIASLIATAGFANAATTLFTSNFDANTGVPTTGYVQNVSGSTTAGVTWTTQDATVTAISGLTSISPGGGFINQGAAYNNADNIYVNHNLNIADRANPRGYSLTFTTDTSWDLGNLSVIAGHTNNSGSQNQSFASDLTYSLSGGSLGAPVTLTKLQVDYNGVDYIDSVFDLSGTTIDAGVYTLSVTENNMGGGGAYAIYNGVTLTAVPEPSSTALLGLGGLALILRRRK